MSYRSISDTRDALDESMDDVGSERLRETVAEALMVSCSGRRAPG